MSAKYEVTTRVRIINWLMTALIKLGLGPQRMVLLTVVGRKSGKPHTIPVALVDQNGARYLVAPYGEMNWVRNARAAGEVSITRGRSSQKMRIQLLEPQAAAPVLKQYIQTEAITRAYFDASLNDPLEAFIAEADRHPVFELVAAG